MAISIKEVSVQNLGPHIRFHFELGRLNLIFGHNENGKTFLVEFLIRSLFRQTSDWRLRESPGRGKVTVAGLNDGRALDFSPDSEHKLEDYLRSSRPGLPQEFSRLLVVKGAEVQVADVDGGIDKRVLKRLLSNRAVLDNIQERISKTVSKARLIEGEISGPRQGILKDRLDQMERLKRIKQLFDEIDKHFSGGLRRELTDQIRSVQERQKLISHARRHLAFETDRKVRELRQQIRERPSQAVRDLRKEIAHHLNQSAALRQKQGRLRQAEAESEHYQWLKHAQAEYQAGLAREIGRPSLWWLAAAIVLIAGGAVLPFFQPPLFGAATLVVALLPAWLYLRGYRRLLAGSAANQEMDDLRAAFREHFGKTLTALPDITAELERLSKEFSAAQVLRDQVDDETRELRRGEREIVARIRTLAGSEAPASAWGEVLDKIEAETSAVEDKLRGLELDLARLDVDPSDFVEAATESKYSKQEEDEVTAEFVRLQAELDEASRAQAVLKQRLCQETGNDISGSWEKIIENLRELHSDFCEQYRQKTATILGQIVVNDVLTELRQEEESKVLQALQSETVQRPILQMTGRYDNLSFDGEQVVVSDQHNIFNLAELSTGAQEQVLLGLRVGLSSNLMGDEKLFLILDDAFQYSDWRRRKLMVDKVADLAKAGWQIIYFTMDDNIRTLFEQKKGEFGDDYRTISLNRSGKAEQQLDLLAG